MKAKELIKNLVKSGMIPGDIVTKEKVSDFKVVEGKLISGKEYFYTFKKVGYMQPNVIMLTTCSGYVYLYQI